VLYLAPDIVHEHGVGIARAERPRRHGLHLGDEHAPDFGPAGGIIHFGYARSDANPGDIAVLFRSGIDNWSVTVRSGVLGAEPVAKLETLRVLGPNPFRSAVALRLDMRQAGPAHVSVHDAAGRLVRTLANGAYPAGSHALQWDGLDDAGRALPAGLYFVSAEAAGTRAAGRVVKLN
jgi:hypothetical protein